MFTHGHAKGVCVSVCVCVSPVANVLTWHNNRRRFEVGSIAAVIPPPTTRQTHSSPPLPQPTHTHGATGET